jgi:hypothetical protein
MVRFGLVGVVARTAVHAEQRAIRPVRSPCTSSSMRDACTASPVEAHDTSNLSGMAPRPILTDTLAR